MSDICEKCGYIVELVAHIGEWDDEIDLYNYVCPSCGDAGIRGLEICPACKKGVLLFNHYNEFIEADIFTCDCCLKDYIKNKNEEENDGYEIK